MSAGKGWFVADHLGRYSIPELVEPEQVLELAAHIFELRIATGEPFKSPDHKDKPKQVPVPGFGCRSSGLLRARPDLHPSSGYEQFPQVSVRIVGTVSTLYCVLHRLSHNTGV